jgi:hypothetical protein
LALGNDVATPLTKAQIASIPQFVKDCEAIVVGIQTIGKTVAGGLGQSECSPTL